MSIMALANPCRAISRPSLDAGDRREMPGNGNSLPLPFF